MEYPSLTLEDIACYYLYAMCGTMTPPPLVLKIRDTTYDHILFNRIIIWGQNIYGTNKKYKTKLLYHIAIKNACCVIEDVPIPYITDLICHHSVKHSSIAIEYIIMNKPSFVTANLCMEAVMHNPVSLDFIIGFAGNFVTPELCMTAVKKDGYCLYRIIQYMRHLLTIELCIAAVTSVPPIIKDLPEEFKTKEVYTAAAQA